MSTDLLRHTNGSTMGYDGLGWAVVGCGGLQWAVVGHRHRLDQYEFAHMAQDTTCGTNAYFAHVYTHAYTHGYTHGYTHVRTCLM